MFNNGYGVVNYLGVDLSSLSAGTAVVDNTGSSFVLVVLFAIWHYSPYAFIWFWRFPDHRQIAVEAAEMDGANAATVSSRHAARDYAGPGDGGDPAHRRMF